MEWRWNARKNKLEQRAWMLLLHERRSSVQLVGLTFGSCHFLLVYSSSSWTPFSSWGTGFSSGTGCKDSHCSFALDGAVWHDSRTAVQYLHCERRKSCPKLLYQTWGLKLRCKEHWMRSRKTWRDGGPLWWALSAVRDICFPKEESFDGQQN